MQPYQVLIISDDKESTSILSLLLDAVGEIVVNPALIASTQDWKEKIKDSIALLIIFLDESVLLSCPTFIELLKTFQPEVPIILIDKNLEPKQNKSYPQLIGTLCWPFKYPAVLKLLQHSQIFYEQKTQGNYSEEKTNPLLFRSLIGNSEGIQRVHKMIAKVSDTDVNVLLLGPSGSGKEVVARNIHYSSKRRHAPFIPLNCGAIPQDLLESELFGHEKGSFTGAINLRKGRFELAQGGTLFLDEIGDMPLQMQVKLLRVLQERVLERVGGSKSIEVDVRIIAATHCNLEEAIEQGKFRKDLYYRLNVFPIEMPGLKERIADFPFLVNDLLSKIKADGRLPIQLSADALSVLCQYDWPGNVRELANLIERLCVLYPGQTVDIGDLPLKFTQNTPQDSIKKENIMGSFKEPLNFIGSQILTQNVSYDSEIFSQEGINLKEYLVNIEKNFIKDALVTAKGVVARAAIILKMRRTTLVEKMKKYGMTSTYS